MKILPALLLLAITVGSTLNAQKITDNPLQVAVIGLTHTHVHWILGREPIGDIEIVAIVESNSDLAARYIKQHGLSGDLVYPTMEAMYTVVQPEAVLAFGSIYEHLAVVEFFAPKGVHIMVEKPLAVSMDHAEKMAALARKHGVMLFTNYETTWYPTNHEVKTLSDNGTLGTLRKVVVHDGHQGPKEIGVNDEFLDWLTDPVLNGGGALTDFGCYGANLITWLKNGEKPASVQALTQTNKPQTYPKVDDQATILLQYPGMQGVIQASWNWTFSRKDMEVYGDKAYAMADNRNQLRTRMSENEAASVVQLPELAYPFNDPFALFAAQIRGTVTPEEFELSSLENNLIVVQILDAARESALTGKRIQLEKD